MRVPDGKDCGGKGASGAARSRADRNEKVAGRKLGRAGRAGCRLVGLQARRLDADHDRRASSQ
jgi:hypothetical protein